MRLEEWLDACDAHMLKAAGIYAILDEDNEVLYVGQTDCFIRRWGEHCKTFRVPTREIFQFVVLEYEDNKSKRSYLEARYIQRLKPKYNHKSADWRDENPLIEDSYVEALADELRYLNIETE